jgi:hypothetical protein
MRGRLIALVAVTLCSLSLGVAHPAAAQAAGERTEEWLERRRAKMDDLEPDEEGAVESALTWIEVSSLIERVRHGWYGIKPAFGGFPSGSGQAVGLEYEQTGLGVRHPEISTRNRFDFGTVGAVSLHGYTLLRGEASLNNVGSTPFNIALVAYHERNAREDFYGVGPDTSADDHSLYERRSKGLGTSLWWRMPSWLGLGAGIWRRDIRVDNRVDASLPDSCTKFGGPRLPACQRDPEYIVYDAAVEVDWRNQGKPVRGGFYALQWSSFRGRHADDLDFDELHIDLQQYFPLLYGNRVFALRAEARLTEPRAGASVPFFLLPKLGGSHQLRGFSYGRFTDRNSLVMQAEYRSEVWMSMDLALFADVGRVAAHRSDLFDSMEVNYGFGLRFMSAESTFLRADFVFGGDAFRFLLLFDDVFDDLSLGKRLTERPRLR